MQYKQEKMKLTLAIFIVDFTSLPDIEDMAVLLKQQLKQEHILQVKINVLLAADLVTIIVTFVKVCQIYIVSTILNSIITFTLVIDPISYIQGASSRKPRRDDYLGMIPINKLSRLIV